MAITLLLLFGVLSANGVELLCASPKDFEANNQDLFKKVSIREEDRAEGKTLLQLLFEQGDQNLEGGDPNVRRIKGVFRELDLSVRLVTVRDEADKANLAQEFVLRKHICSKSLDVAFKSLISCRSGSTANFFGCVEEGNNIFVFEEFSILNLNVDWVRSNFQKLEPFQRVVLMLEVIERFINLQEFGVVHGDIRPENIAIANTDEDKFRILNLRTSNFVASSPSTEAPFFPLPEKYYGGSDKKLSFERDVYALAMTFVALEGNGLNEFHKRNPDCFGSVENKYFDVCLNSFRETVVSTFGLGKQLYPIYNVILRATNIQPNERYQLMEDFSNDLVHALQELPGVEDYFYELAEEIKNRPKGTPLSFWIKYGVEKGYIQEKNFILKQFSNPKSTFVKNGLKRLNFLEKKVIV